MAARGVEQQHVIALQTGRLERTLGNLDRGLARHDRQRVDVGLAAEHGQLLLRRRTGDVERCHQHLLALTFRQALGQLGGGGGLTRALETDHHDDGRRIDVEVEFHGLRPSISTSASLTILTTIWPGVTERITSAPRRALRHLVDEIAGDRQSDIGFEQCDANLAHRPAHVVFRQRAATAELVEDAGQRSLSDSNIQNSKIDWPQRKRRRRAKPRRPACPEGRHRCMSVKTGRPLR